MTKEDAIKVLNMVEAHGSIVIQAKEMAIKALEQEPIIDKIRAEIENDWQLKEYPSSPFSCGLRRAVEIIDKYRQEGKA